MVAKRRTKKAALASTMKWSGSNQLDVVCSPSGSCDGAETDEGAHLVGVAADGLGQAVGPRCTAGSVTCSPGYGFSPAWARYSRFGRAGRSGPGHCDWMTVWAERRRGRGERRRCRRGRRGRGRPRWPSAKRSSAVRTDHRVCHRAGCFPAPGCGRRCASQPSRPRGRGWWCASGEQVLPAPERGVEALLRSRAESRLAAGLCGRRW